MGWDFSRQTHSVEVWTVQKLQFFLLIEKWWHSWVFGPLSAAPSSAVIVGVFGQRLSEFRGGLRGVQAARASFAGRPR